MPTKYFHGADFDSDNLLLVDNKAPKTDEFMVRLNCVPPVMQVIGKPPVGFFRSMADRELDSIAGEVYAELRRRNELVEQKSKGRVLFGDPTVRDMFSNFLRGVAHAMACRAALRWGMGHRAFSPDGAGPGSKTVGGTCWNIFDVSKLGAKLTEGAGSQTTIVNSNPLLWSASPGSVARRDDLKFWLAPSQLLQYRAGSRFCCSKT